MQSSLQNCSSLANTEDRDRHNPLLRSTKQVLYMKLVQNITQICLGGIIYSVYFVPNVSNYSDSLTQHIILCTLGYIILMTQGIMSFNPVGWAKNLKYNSKIKIYYSLQFLGAILAIIGSVKRISDIGLKNSGHAISGLVTILAALFTLFYGLLCLMFPLEIIKTIYSYLSSGTTTFAFINLIFAFHYNYRLLVGDANANLAIVLTVVALIGTLFTALFKNYKNSST